ncbi:MAG: MazG family protein [Verrucomicrobia bacterium]|nr:MazG family protein [Verrucomicrobiota bacterium]
MKEFDELLEVANRLMGPNGCPWDHKQTFFSLQPYVLEEAHEVIEAVDGQNDFEIIEELGDLLYTVIFYAKIAEKENRFSMKAIIQSIKDKLIRRHPHVFGSIEAKTEEEIVKNWNLIKGEEKGKEHRVSALDGIPDSLPTLSKAQKMVKVFERTKFASLENQEIKKEDEIAEELLALIQIAERSGVDIESALRRKLALDKKRFTKWEES